METKRLYFRERTTEILDGILNQSVKEQMNYFGFKDLIDFKLELTRIEKLLTIGDSKFKKWDLIEKDTRLVMGNCGFHNWIFEHERAELGYVLYESFQGKGFMGEALQCIIEYGFWEMNLNRIEAFISPGNAPSIRLIKKLGFIQEGILREHYKFKNHIYDSLAFSLLKSEYKN